MVLKSIELPYEDNHVITMRGKCRDADPIKYNSNFKKTRKALQQKEFNNAYNHQGNYVIIDYWGDTYDGSDEEINEMYKHTYPDSTFTNDDITSPGYMNMVQLLIDIYTGKSIFPLVSEYDEDDDHNPPSQDTIYTILLKWLPIEVVKSNAWSYDPQVNIPDFIKEDHYHIYRTWSLTIDLEKVELFNQVKLYEKHIHDTFPLVHTAYNNLETLQKLMKPTT
jgi:hypothetical protein